LGPEPADDDCESAGPLGVVPKIFGNAMLLYWQFQNKYLFQALHSKTLTYI